MRKPQRSPHFNRSCPKLLSQRVLSASRPQTIAHLPNQTCQRTLSLTRLQTSRSPPPPSRKILQSGPHASSAACSPQSRRWIRSSSHLQLSAVWRCTSPESPLPCCQSHPTPANPPRFSSPLPSSARQSTTPPGGCRFPSTIARVIPGLRSLASPVSFALRESWDTPRPQARHRGFLQLRNLLLYCPFPPPGIAAVSLPDTISAPLRSQRLTTAKWPSTAIYFTHIYRSFAGKVSADSTSHG